MAAKADVANPAKLKKLKAMAKRRKLPYYEISAVTGEGIEPLKYAIADLVQTHRPIPLAEPAEAPKSANPFIPHPPALPAEGRN